MLDDRLNQIRLAGSSFFVLTREVRLALHITLTLASPERGRASNWERVVQHCLRSAEFIILQTRRNQFSYLRTWLRSGSSHHTSTCHLHLPNLAICHVLRASCAQRPQRQRHKMVSQYILYNGAFHLHSTASQCRRQAGLLAQNSLLITQNPLGALASPDYARPDVHAVPEPDGICEPATRHHRRLLLT